MLPYNAFTEFNIGPLTIQIWGLMVSLGFIAGLLLIMKQAKDKGFDVSPILDLALIIFVAAIVGSRVFYVILFWESFVGDWWSVFRIWEGGMVFFGGFIFAVLGWIIFARYKKMDFWLTADWAAPALALGMAIGRIGCHFIRDHPGIPTDVWWGADFNGVIRHETAMYSVLANLVIFLLIWFWFRKLKLPQGMLFAIYLVWYGVTRFIIDFYRALDLPHSDPRFLTSGGFAGLTISQIISIVLVVGGIFLAFYLKKRQFKMDKAG